MPSTKAKDLETITKAEEAPLIEHKHDFNNSSIEGLTEKEGMWIL